MVMSDDELNRIMDETRDKRRAEVHTINAAAKALRDVHEHYIQSPYRNSQTIGRRAAKLADGIEELLKRMYEPGRRA